MKPLMLKLYSFVRVISCVIKMNLLYMFVYKIHSAPLNEGYT